VAKLRASIGALGGGVVVERAPPAGTTDAWGVDGPDLALMRRLKDAYDSGGCLNPGRYVGGL
jgi:hypothetical protein